MKTGHKLVERNKNARSQELKFFQEIKTSPRETISRMFYACVEEKNNLNEIN